MPVIGDTVRLTAVFRDFNDDLVDPTTVVVQMYDNDKVALGVPVTLDSSHRLSAGTYFYDYTIPTGYKKLYYEFKGTSQDLPSVARGEIQITWL